MDERREFTRIHRKIRALIDFEGRRIEGHSRDVSTAGALVVCGEPPTEGAACVCTLELVEREVSIRAQATVVRVLAEGVALHFDELLGPESFEHLRALIRYNADDIDQVERENASHLGLKRIP